MTIEALAHKAGLDRTYIPGIEKGKRNVSILVIEKTAKALEVKISSLFNDQAKVQFITGTHTPAGNRSQVLTLQTNKNSSSIGGS